MVKAALKREVVPGINRLGRSKRITVTKRFLHFKKGPQEKPEKKEKKAAPRGYEPKWYIAEDRPHPIPSRKSHHKPTRLRKTIRPGKVLIILAGRFKGKRVVFLKQLPSGLLLVTGPYKINGVPLRRVNQAYVISTTTSVDVSKVDVSNIDDEFFAKKLEDQPKGKVSKAFNPKKHAYVSKNRQKVQKDVDTVILNSIKTVPQLKHYLNAKFSLTNGMFPHAVKF